MNVNECSVLSARIFQWTDAFRTWTCFPRIFKFSTIVAQAFSQFVIDGSLHEQNLHDDISHEWNGKCIVFETALHLHLKIEIECSKNERNRYLITYFRLNGFPLTVKSKANRRKRPNFIISMIFFMYECILIWVLCIYRTLLVNHLISKRLHFIDGKDLKR